MRNLIRVVVASLILTCPARAIADGQLIPQDPAKQAKRFRDMLEWNRRTLAGAYERVGKKDDRWDRHARAALEAAAQHFSHAVDPVTYPSDVHNAAMQAVVAGCNDPLVLYLYARTTTKEICPDADELDRRWSKAAAAMKDSDYPSFRRFIALSHAGSEKADRYAATRGVRTPEVRTKIRKEAEALLTDALRALSLSAAEDRANLDIEHQWVKQTWSMVVAYGKLKGDQLKGFEAVEKELAKTPALTAVRLNVKGQFYRQYAWQARGTGFADTVTELGWEKFHERMTVARAALEQAWELKPDVLTAEHMLVIETADSEGRAAMEKWFNRTITAGGNSATACAYKLNWLDPKWHGSEKELLEFGKACRDTKNWRSGITLLAADAHRRVAEHRDRQNKGSKAFWEYMSSPEVFADIWKVYPEYLRHYPLDYRARTQFATFCCWGARWEAAHDQFQILGDHLWSGQGFPKDLMQQLKQQAADYVAAKSQPSGKSDK